MTDWLTDRRIFVIVESLLRLKNNICQTSDQNCGQVGNPIRLSEGNGGWGRVGDLWDLRILSPPTSSAFSLSSSPTTASIYHLSATFRWLNINSCSCLCNGLSDLDLIKITNDQMILPGDSQSVTWHTWYRQGQCDHITTSFVILLPAINKMKYLNSRYRSSERIKSTSNFGLGKRMIDEESWLRKKVYCQRKCRKLIGEMILRY